MSGYSRGIFEYTREEFSKKTKGLQGSGTLEKLDFSQSLPDYFPHTKKFPPSMEKVWRMVLDKNLRECGGGYYCYAQEASILIFFDKIPATTARLKVEKVVREVDQILRDGLHKDQERLENAVSSHPEKEKKKVGGDSVLTRVMKEGLHENATHKELKLWAERQTQEMLIAREKDCLAPDLISHAGLMSVSYFPLWNSAAQTITGNFLTPISAPGYNGEARAARIDISCLVLACAEAQRLLRENMQTLTIFPVQLKTLQEKSLFELFLGILRNNNPAVSNILAIELKGLPSGNLSNDAKAGLLALSAYCKAFVINSGILTTSEYSLEGKKPHAYGFDLSESRLPEDKSLHDKVSRFAGYYKARGMKTYAKGLSSKSLLKTALDSGITYLSGPAVSPPQRSSMPIRPLAVARLVS